MKILLSELPISPWWGKGMPHYQNNIFMKKGTIPDQNIVNNEYRQFRYMLENITEVVSIPFPDILDTYRHYKHDFVFVRDHFISDQQGMAVMSNFSEIHRQEETEVTSFVLKSLGMKVYSLSTDAYAEGGDFHFHPQTKILFAGTVRNNRKGVLQTAKLLRAKKVCIIESRAFHLDSLFSPVIDKNNTLIAVITSPEGIHNWNEVRTFLQYNSIQILHIPLHDCIGSPLYHGSLAVNCLILPGILIGCCAFTNPAVEKKLKSFGIHHEITPTTQFRLSGGSIHCLTNELF